MSASYLALKDFTSRTTESWNQYSRPIKVADSKDPSGYREWLGVRQSQKLQAAHISSTSITSLSPLRRGLLPPACLTDWAARALPTVQLQSFPGLPAPVSFSFLPPDQLGSTGSSSTSSTPPAHTSRIPLGLVASPWHLQLVFAKAPPRDQSPAPASDPPCQVLRHWRGQVIQRLQSSFL